MDGDLLDESHQFSSVLNRVDGVWIFRRLRMVAPDPRLPASDV